MTAPQPPAEPELRGDGDGWPVAYGEPMLQFSDPLTFEPGHPLRGTHCVLCGSMIGGRAFRFVQLVMCFEAACQCGQLPTISRVICIDHGEPDAVKVVPAILDFVHNAHPGEWAHGSKAGR